MRLGGVCVGGYRRPFVCVVSETCDIDVYVHPYVAVDSGLLTVWGYTDSKALVFFFISWNVCASLPSGCSVCKFVLVFVFRGAVSGSMTVWIWGLYGVGFHPLACDLCVSVHQCWQRLVDWGCSRCLCFVSSNSCVCKFVQLSRYKGAYSGLIAEWILRHTGFPLKPVMFVDF